MSKKFREPVNCPRCGTVNTVTMFASLNVDIDPEGKVALFNGTLNSFKCSGCGQGITTLTDMLYHDMSKNYMIYLMTSHEGRRKNLDKELASMKAFLPGYKYRIVHSYDRLSEKVRIFDDQLDDRIIKALKMLAMNRIYKDGLHKEFDSIFYNGMRIANYAKELKLLIFFKNGESMMMSTPYNEGYLTTLADLQAVLEKEDRNNNWLDVNNQYMLDLAEAKRAVKKPSWFKKR